MTRFSRKPPLFLAVSVFFMACLPLLGGLHPLRAEEAVGRGPDTIPWEVEALPGGPRRIPKALARALDALAEGSFEESARWAEAFLGRTSDPRYDAWRKRARLVAARAYLEAERPSETLRLLEEGGAPPPRLGEERVRFLKARALERLGRHRAAAEIYASIGGKEAAAARAWYRAGDCPRAVSAALALEKRSPAHAEIPAALLLRGKCRQERGDLSGAARLFQRLWLRHPLDPAAAEAEERLADLRGRGVAVPPPGADALLRRARALQGANRISGALRAWRTLLKRPLSREARIEAAYSVGLDLYFLRDNRGAAERLRWVADQDRPGGWGAKALYYLARVRLRQRDPQGFRKTGGELLAAHPGSVWARRFLYLQARVEEDDGRLDRALGRYRRLAKEHPGTRQADEARWRIGWIHFRRGRFSEAEHAFSDLGKERSRTPLGQAAFFWAGRAAERAGRPTAPSYYRSAVRLDPASYYGQSAARRLGLRDGLGEDAGDSPRFLARPPLGEKSRKVVGEAEALFLAGFFRAAAETLEGGGLDGPYFLYQRARLLHRARDYREAFRTLRRPAFWGARVGRNRPPAEFWRILYPLDRRTLKAGENRRGMPDPLLVSAVVLAESEYDRDALSVAGARGLMQLMPGTGRRIARSLGLPPPSPEDLFRPELNVRLGGRFLGNLLAHFGGRVAPAVAAYNAGREAAQRWWKENGHLDEASFIALIPYRETRRYVRRVLGYYRQYQRTYRESRMRGSDEAAAGGAP